jgi:predicted transcriptional regulator
VKQLSQIVRGATALGLSIPAAMALALRCAHDSLPPLRLAMLHHVAAHPDTTTKQARQTVDKPRTTVDRCLQDLHVLGLLTAREEDDLTPGGRYASVWHYSLSPRIDPAALLDLSVSRNVGGDGYEEKIQGEGGGVPEGSPETLSDGTYISGHGESPIDRACQLFDGEVTTVRRLPPDPAPLPGLEEELF